MRTQAERASGHSSVFGELRNEKQNVAKNSQFFQTLSFNHFVTLVSHSSVFNSNSLLKSFLYSVLQFVSKF